MSVDEVVNPDQLRSLGFILLVTNQFLPQRIVLVGVKAS